MKSLLEQAGHGDTQLYAQNLGGRSRRNHRKLKVILLYSTSLKGILWADKKVASPDYRCLRHHRKGSRQKSLQGIHGKQDKESIWSVKPPRNYWAVQVVKPLFRVHFWLSHLFWLVCLCRNSECWHQCSLMASQLIFFFKNGKQMNHYFKSKVKYTIKGGRKQ